MARQDRAKQFAPFDALKGLQEALRMKEYQHERTQKGDLSEEKIEEISKTLLSLEKGNFVFVRYFEDGHYLETEGRCIVDFSQQFIIVGSAKISFDDLVEIKLKN